MSKQLTLKQREFVKQYVQNGGNGTQAALVAYDTDDANTAHAIASDNLRKPTVKREIELALERAGLSDDYISELLREATVSGIGNKATNADSLRGIEMMLRLKGAFPSTTQHSSHVRVDYRMELEKMSIQDLKAELGKAQGRSQQLQVEVVATK